MEPKPPQPKPFVQEEDDPALAASHDPDGKPLWSMDDAEPITSDHYWHGKIYKFTTHTQNRVSRTHISHTESKK